MQSEKRSIQYISISLLIVIVGFTTYYMKMLGIIDLPCYFYKYTHLYCMACGATRLLTSILNLEFIQAFRWNPFMFISIPFYIYIWVECGAQYSETGRVKDKTCTLLLIYIVLFFLFGVIRNIPTFSFLAPTKI